MSESLLALNGVCVTYFRGGRHRVPVLRGVSFQVERGEFVAIVGDPTGGKTTLLQVAGGLLEPDTGVVLIDGKELIRGQYDLDPRVAIAAGGDPPRELLQTTVLDLVAIPLLETMSSPKAQQRAADALRVFHVDDLNRSTWSELSDVERTLVRIAQATVRDPMLLLVDDPMRGLGLSHIEAVDWLLRQAASRGTAVVMTVGNLQDGERADRMLTLAGGTIISAPQAAGDLIQFPLDRGA